MSSQPPDHASTHLSGMGLMLTAIILGGIMPVMDSTIVSIGLQTLIASFHTTAATIQWVTTSYLLAMAVAVPVVGWAQARFGGRPLWIAGIATFTAGSILCSLAWSVGALIAFRAPQGFAAGLLMPLMQTLGMQEAKRQGITTLGSLMSTLSLPIAIGPILGPVLGGAVLNWASWHWLFLINVPIGVVALIVAIPAFHDERPDPGQRSSLDVVGFLSVSGGLATLLLGLTNIAREDGLAHPDVLVPLATGVALLIFFVAWPRSHDPRRTLIDITLLRVRSVVSASSALFLVGAALYAGQFLLPLYWQDLRGQSVLDAALLLVPQGVGSLLSRIVAGRLTDRFGGRTIAVLGFLLTAATTLPFCFAGTQTGNLSLSGILFLRGLALGVLFIPVMTVAYLDIDGPSIPHASILTRVSQQVGASVGTAVAAVVLESSVRSHQLSAEQSFHAAFTATVVITLLGAVLSLWLPGRTAATPSS
ncbi:MAG: MDR family MFS transporter [Propionibacterium sp.]